MPELTHDLPSTTAEWRQLWRFTLDPFRCVRRPTREVRAGDVGIGAANPIRLQSMTISDTLDTDAVVAEIEALHAAGSEMVRVTAPNRSSAENLRIIRARLRQRGVRVPLVADIHFTPQAALIAAEHVEKVRVNPGNYADRKHFKKWEYTDSEYQEELERLEASFRPLVLRCKELGVAMRIGTNHGSLSDRIMNRYGDTPLGMVESALEFVRIGEHHGYRDIVLSMKASDVKVMIAAYRLLSARLRDLGMDYPFHLGVTEAGSGLAARVKSAIGIVTLLEDGIGDTVRVSLTEDSVHEIPVARALVQQIAAAGAAGPTGSLDVVPRWDPYRFARREVDALGSGAAGLASDRPPRLEIVETLPEGMSIEAATAVIRRGLEREACENGADLLLYRLDLPPRRGAGLEAGVRLLEALAPLAAMRLPAARPALGIEIPARLLQDPRVREAARAWQRVSLLLDAEDLAAGAELPVADPSQLPPLQYTVDGHAADPIALEQAGRHLAARCPDSLPPGALGIDFGASDRYPGPQGVRRLLSTWTSVHRPPLVLRAALPPHSASVDGHVSRAALRLAAAFGALLADGVGEALQLHAGPDAEAARRLASEILQATRLRLSKADFISCPSCGRTQFDLQTTSARIEAQLKHLKGLKIAIMGCIVNGPGEMADADFGYVGSGPGRIDLYVGKERVERNVPEAEAETRLVELIRRHDRWVDPQPPMPAD